MPALARGIAHSVVRQDKEELLETLPGLQFSVVRKKHRKPLKGSLLSGNPEVASYGKVGKRNLCLGRDGDIASPKHMRQAGHFIKTCVVQDEKKSGSGRSSRPAALGESWRGKEEGRGWQGAVQGLGAQGKVP